MKSSGYFRPSVARGVEAALLTFPFDGDDVHSIATAWCAARHVADEQGGHVVVCNPPAASGAWDGAVPVGAVTAEMQQPAPPRRPSGVRPIAAAVAEIRERLRGMRGLADKET